jgi:hypothetical protein
MLVRTQSAIRSEKATDISENVALNFAKAPPHNKQNQ